MSIDGLLDHPVLTARNLGLFINAKLAMTLHYINTFIYRDLQFKLLLNRGLPAYLSLDLKACSGQIGVSVRVAIETWETSTFNFHA